MKAIKLSQVDYQRSLKANVEHLWVYNRFINEKKIHNNDIFLNRWKGRPQLCIVIDNDAIIQDHELEEIFGKGSFINVINGGVSPYDKEQMAYDCYYIKK
jgi:hypothetical protein